MKAWERSREIRKARTCENIQQKGEGVYTTERVPAYGVFLLRDHMGALVKDGDFGRARNLNGRSPAASAWARPSG